MTELGLSYFDIAAIVFIVLFLWLGIKRGFLQELGKIVSMIISLVGAKILSYPIEPKMYEILGVEEKLVINVQKIVDNVDFTSLESARDTLTVGLNDMPIVGQLINGLVEDNWNITNIIQKASATIQTELSDYILESIRPVVHNILNMACFIGIFIILYFIVSIIVGIIVNGLTSIKVIGSTDKLLGGLIGLVKGCLFIIILYSVLFLALSLSGSEYLQILMDSKFFDIVIGIKDVIPVT